MKHNIISERWELNKGISMKESEKPPKHTIVAYKLVQIKPNLTILNHKVYPLFVNSDNDGWEIGKWYDAGIGDYMVEFDDNTNEPTGKIKVKASTGNGGLSFRPGLHFGSIPFAPHIFKKGENFEKEKNNIENYDTKGKLKKDYDYNKSRTMKKNTVWVQCYISFDIDYQDEAIKNGNYIRNGKTINNAKNSYLKHIPTNGSYRFKTNSNAPSYETWYIAGQFKINKIMSDEEVERICQQNNIKSLKRDEILDLSKYF